MYQQLVNRAIIHPYTVRHLATATSRLLDRVSRLVGLLASFAPPPLINNVLPGLTSLAHTLLHPHRNQLDPTLQVRYNG